MPNSIALFKQYVPLLDEVYKNASLTSVLDGASELVSQGARANELIIPKMSMDGLGDYSRNGGYTAGDVTMTNETVQCNFDRGRMFSIDAMDDIETAGIAYGRLSAEFIRTKVVPEVDAFRLAKYAGVSGISVETGSLTTGEAVIAAISAAYDGMTDAEVPESERYLFITPTLLGLTRDMDRDKSREVLDKFAGIITVPQSRFYTAIDQLSGGVGETAGGYKKAEHKQEYTATASQTEFTVTDKPAAVQKVTINGTATDAYTYNASTGKVTLTSGATVSDAVVVIYNTGVNINFMAIHKPAVIQFQKHIAPKVVTPEANQDADAWKFGYRNVGIADAYENKVAGIYLHKVAL